MVVEANNCTTLIEKGRLRKKEAALFLIPVKLKEVLIMALNY